MSPVAGEAFNIICAVPGSFVSDGVDPDVPFLFSFHDLTGKQPRGAFWVLKLPGHFPLLSDYLNLFLSN